MVSPDRSGKLLIAFERGAMEWVGSLREQFHEDELDLWPNTSIAASEDWGDRFDESLHNAKAVVVLLSEKFLNSEYREYQRAWHSMEKANDGGLPVVLVVLESCGWPELEPLRMMASREGRSRVIELDALDPDSRRKAWVALGTELRREFFPNAEPESKAQQEPEQDYRRQWVPQSRIDDYPLKEAPRQIIRVARELAQRQGRGLLPLSTSCLLFTLQNQQPSWEPVLGRAAAFIAQYLERHGKERLAEIQDRFFLFQVNLASSQHRSNELDRIHTSESMTPNVEAVLQSSVAIADATSGADVESRHFLAALLIAGDHAFGARERLKELEIDRDDLRKAFLEFIGETHPEENQENWRAALEGAAVKGGKTARSKKKKTKASKKRKAPARRKDDENPVPPMPGVLLAGFDADYWNRHAGAGNSNPDLLDIQDEVNALASLAAAWSVEPPLSIGLFGDWGSGKTFFMRKMMERVNVLSKAARDSGRHQRDIGFYKNIVQIEFNAWHYVEGNLWASLVEHIFTNLRFSEQEPESAVQERQTKLIREIKLEEELKQRSERKREAAMQRAEAAGELRDQKRAEAIAIELQDIWKEEGISDELKKRVRARLKELGFIDTLEASQEQLSQAMEEAVSLWGRVKVQLRLAREHPAQLRNIVGAVACLAAMSVVPMLVSWINSLLSDDDISRAAKVIAGTLGAAGTAAGWLKSFAQKASGKLSVIERLQREAREQKDSQLAEINVQIHAAEQEVLEANKEIARHNTRIAELQEEVKTTTTGRLLAEFLEERADSQDYRRHLGILALIRRDFEKLSDLVTQQREEERRGEEPLDDSNRINRIILYIDDLDRCPPNKVVEVLQAIHLLLAFPLFVVVVGVDSRWISRSLEKMYHSLLNPPAEGDGREDSERLPGHGATPRDYLEKIFQIPFWIRPMQSVDSRRLIEGLTQDSKRTEQPSIEVALVNETGQSKLDQAEMERKGSPDSPAQSGKAAAHQPQRWVGSAPQESNVQSTDRIESIIPEDVPKPAAAAVPANEPSHVELAPRTLQLESWELEFMNELTAVLTRSPRSVKRFINCYRLIKAGLRPEQVAAFVGEASHRGGYEPVLLLLAILNGAPAVADKILDRLTNPCPSFTFQELIAAIDLYNHERQTEEWSRIKAFLKSHWFPQRESSNWRRFTLHQMIEELNAFADQQEANLRKESREFLETFAVRLDHYSLEQLADELNADTELAGRSEWARVHKFLKAYAARDSAQNDLQALRRAAPFVARFSFRIAHVRPGDGRPTTGEMEDALPAV